MPEENIEADELPEAELDEITGGTKNTIAPMSNKDMFQLQQLMEQKSQLESMLSNVMKAASDTQSGIAGKLKGS